MSEPTRYLPGFNYSGWEADHPTEPKPGAELDNDFALIRHSIDETIRALRDVRRSDGKVQNASVDFDALSPAVKAAIAGSEFDYEVIDDLLAKDANLSDLPDKAAALANLGLSDVLTFPTAASVAFATLGPEVTAFRTNGFSLPGDGGQALYVRGQQRPGAIQDADGDWWELVPEGGGINILAFGAKADGDGAGGGTDNTDAINAALELASLSGVKAVNFPNVGTGVYTISGVLGPVSEGLEISGNGSMLYNLATSLSAFRPRGSLDSVEVPLGASAMRGDDVLQTASAHGLDAGDWCLLVSQRQAQYEQPPGANSERLGDVTSLPGTYFAEPLRVKSVQSATSFEIEQGLFYTDYHPDNSLETVPGSEPRAASTIQKINWLEGVKIHGFRYRTRGASFVDSRWTKDCTYSYIDSDSGDVEARCVVFVNTYRCTARHVSHRQNAGSATGMDSNSFRDTSSWFNTWDYIYGENLWQAIDCSYRNGEYPGRSPSFYSIHMKRCQQALNTHQAVDGGLVDGLISEDCLTGISARSPNWDFVNYRIISTTGGGGAFAGLYSQGWARNCRFRGGSVVGFNRGFLYDRKGNYEIGPAFANIAVTGTQFLKCVNGVYLRDSHGSSETPTAENSGIVIGPGNTFEACENYGVIISAYRNGVTVFGNVFGRMTGSSPVAIEQRRDAVDPIIEGNLFDHIGSNSTGISTSTIQDTATFPNYTGQQPHAWMRANRFLGLVGQRHSHSGTNRTPFSRQEGPNGPVDITGTSMAATTHVIEDNNSTVRVFQLAADDCTDNSYYLGTASNNLAAGIRYNDQDNRLLLVSGGEMRVAVNGASGAMFPMLDGAQRLGGQSNRWSEVYAETGSINTSDERLKQDVRSLTQSEIDALSEIGAVVYRFKSAVATKGVEAREHVGVIAQHIVEAFSKRGLDPFNYGFLCGDLVYDTETWFDEDGIEHSELSPRLDPDTGEHMFQLSVRYDELLTALWAADRQRLMALENRVSQLEA